MSSDHCSLSPSALAWERVIQQLARPCCHRVWLASHMVGKLLNPARLRSIITVVSRGARAIGNRYLEAGCTQAETRAINVLKEWLSQCHADTKDRIGNRRMQRISRRQKVHTYLALIPFYFL